MKIILIVLFSLITAATVMGRSDSKKVIVTTLIQTVPKGMKWSLEVNKPARVQVSESVFDINSASNKSYYGITWTCN